MNEKYIPLYRKYRPQKLEELVGQEHIKNALKNAIELNKISHAYLFTGPRGTGKTSTARIFAKSLNCKNGPTISPCGKCESCIDITNTVPMDVIEIDAASNRKVEDTQNILEKILYAPVHGKYKIYIIDEVHMLSSTAFNSLLKTLEEPPANVIFILATTEVHKVLDTIKSRCQRFDFRRITTDDIVKHLKYISECENIEISDDALFTIAKNSAGGMRDSIALLDQLSVLGANSEITTDDINKLLGRVSFDILSELANSIITSKPDTSIEILEKIYNSGNEPVQILSNLLDYLKNLLIVKTCRKDILINLTQLNDSQIKFLNEQSEKVEAHQIISLIDKCSNYIKELKLASNPRLWLEVSIIDLSNLVENTKLEELQKRLSLLENGDIKHMPQTSAYKTPPSPVSKPEIIHKPVEVQETNKKSQSVVVEDSDKKTDIKEDKPQETKQPNVSDEFSPMPKSHSSEDDSGNINELWFKLLDEISSVPVKSLLKQFASPVVLSGDKVEISLKGEMYVRQFTEGNKRDKLLQAVNSVFGHSNVIVRLPLPDDKPLNIDNFIKKKPIIPPTTPAETVSQVEEIPELPVEKVTANKTKIKDSMHSDMVNMVVEMFDGKIID